MEAHGEVQQRRVPLRAVNLLSDAAESCHELEQTRTVLALIAVAPDDDEVVRADVEGQLRGLR